MATSARGRPRRSGPTQLSHAGLAPTPVLGAPALLVGPDRPTTPRTLIVADLHLGLAGTEARPTGPPGGSAPELAARLIDIARRGRASRVIVAGDVKHPIVGVPRPLRSVIFDFFSTVLEEGLAVDVVLGNHDAGLTPHLPREVSVQPATGAVHAGLGIFHGQRWPSAPVLAQRRWVTGHLHPGFRFAPTPAHPDGKRPCWVRARFDRRRSTPDPAGRSSPLPRELIVLPPFNPLAGVEALNRERPSRGRSFLYRRFLAFGEARAYLTDGTDLGILPTPKGSAATPGAARTARSAS